MDFGPILDTATTQLSAFGLKAVGAILVWIVGRRLIALAAQCQASKRRPRIGGWPPSRARPFDLAQVPVLRVRLEPSPESTPVGESS